MIGILSTDWRRYTDPGLAMELHSTPLFSYFHNPDCAIWQLTPGKQIMKKNLTTLFIVLLVSGCAPATIDGLRKDHANQISFHVNENYQPIYRKVLSMARQCYQTGMITAQLVVQGDLYHDIKSGSVTVALHGGFGVETHLVVDIDAIDEGASKITVYNALPSWNSASQAVREWVEDGATECRPRRV